MTMAMHAPDGRKRKMSESDALFAAADNQRLRKPVLVTGVRFAAAVTVIQPSEFSKLGIDESYQRGRVSNDVNTLINVLRSGGQIPSPIDVAERPDGSLWIVDGQQRFLAHEATQTPLKAHIHLVENVAAESRLFVALNSRRNLNPRVVIKGWPGPFGEFIRKMNTNEKSPLRGLIDLTNNSKLPLDASTVLAGIICVLTGGVPSGDTITAKLPRTDAALRMPGGLVWAEAFMQLVAAVFGMKSGAGRVRMLPVIALGRVAHRKYKIAGRPVFPKSCARLRGVNWDTAVPSHARQYLPLLEERIEKLWR